MWLLVLQRLQGGVSLERAVLELLRGLPASFWPHPCKRLRDWQQHGKPLSSHTGAYNQARQALPLSLVQQSCDRIFEQLMAEVDQSASEHAPRAFILDGSSIRLAHSPELCRRYPPVSNQHGTGHWPVVRVLVAHDLHTGLAMRPEWGPIHGPDAVSEQRLLDAAIGRLPSGATVIGDANFGVFSVAYAATQTHHPVLLRLTVSRAGSMVGHRQLRDGIDRAMVWKPTANDRKSHPDLPVDACVRGRIIVRLVQPSNGAEPFLLSLFTTLSSSQEEVLELYGQRWNIETDLRTLKAALQLEHLTCSTSDMAAKEIEMGLAAYNLVRALTCQASRQSGIPPRGYSFTKVQAIVEIFAPKLAEAPDEQAARQIFEQMMHYVQQAKLPRRKRKRPSYPRQVWNRGGGSFPHRKS